jgi:CRISPR-associated protein Cas2
MVVMFLQKTPRRLRGELTLWLLEPYPEVFVGHVNAMVRDRLWNKCCKACGAGGVLQIWNANNEQGFKMRMHGNIHRQVVDYEGLQLIKIPFSK